MRMKVTNAISKLDFHKFRPLKKFITKITAVILIILVVSLLKKINFRQTNILLGIIKDNIQYEFSIRNDGKKIYGRIREIVGNSKEILNVFNPFDSDKYPSPIKGSVYKSYNKNSNLGIDIRAESDEEPLFIMEGIITDIVKKDKQGYFVTVKSDNIDFTYGYFLKVYLSKGDKVSSGEPIGILGTNIDGRRYLRFEAWVDDLPVDPLNYIEIK